MTVQLIIAICAICSLISTVAGVIIGNVMGAKIALAKVETWMDIREGDIRALQKDVGVNRDDLMALDYEMSAALAKLDIPRVRRQALR